jgi:hypothetical protein
MLPTRKDSLLDHMRDLCQRFVDKGLLEFSYVHHLIWEYVSECDGLTSRFSDLVNLLSDSALKLITTKPGAKVMCTIISNSSAKDRKKILKSLKGHVLESLLHDSGHLAIMRLVDVTDDTVNVQKMLLDEIMIPQPMLKYSATGEQINDPFPPLIKIAKHQFGRKLLLRLLSPQKRHLEPDEESLFTLESIATGTSKKNPNVRRHEHVVYLRNPLLQIVSSNLHYLITCPMGSTVLLEVISTFFPSQILSQVVDMFCGQYVIPERGNMISNQALAAAGAEVVDDDEDDDEEEEEEEEEDAAEENDEDEEEEGNENEENGEEEEDEYDEEDLQQALKEDGETYGEEPQTTTPSKRATASYPVPDLTSLEEHPIAQLLLKRILDLQTTAETQDDKSEVTIDQSLWEQIESEEDETDEGQKFYQFALHFIDSIFPNDSEKLSQWIEKNRPSFILSDLLKVPSAHDILLKKLKAFKKQIKTSSKTLAGSKCLLAQMERK